MAETEVKKINGRTVCDQTARDSIPKSASDIGADPAGTGASKVNAHNISLTAHADIRVQLQNIADQLNAFLNVDDETRNELSEVLDLIDANEELIASITTNKVDVKDIIDNLTTNVSNKPLSAAQGVALKKLIDELQTVINNMPTSERFEQLSKEIDDLKQNGTGTTVTGGSVKTILSNIMTIMRAQVNPDGTPQVYNPDISSIADITDELIANLGTTEEPDKPDEPTDPSVTLSSISAIYTGGDVEVGTVLSSLKGITVTATYSDGSTAIVSGYTLSGEITEGQNTITVTYKEMTTTFTVIGIAEVENINIIQNGSTLTIIDVPNVTQNGTTLAIA